MQTFSSFVRGFGLSAWFIFGLSLASVFAQNQTQEPPAPTFEEFLEAHYGAAYLKGLKTQEKRADRAVFSLPSEKTTLQIRRWKFKNGLYFFGLKEVQRGIESDMLFFKIQNQQTAEITDMLLPSLPQYAHFLAEEGYHITQRFAKTQAEERLALWLLDEENQSEKQLAWLRFDGYRFLLEEL
jgi:hypothetical protein